MMTGIQDAYSITLDHSPVSYPMMTGIQDAYSITLDHSPVSYPMMTGIQDAYQDWGKHFMYSTGSPIPYPRPYIYSPVS